MYLKNILNTLNVNDINKIKVSDNCNQNILICDNELIINNNYFKQNKSSVEDFIIEIIKITNNFSLQLDSIILTKNVISELIIQAKDGRKFEIFNSVCGAHLYDLIDGNGLITNKLNFSIRKPYDIIEIEYLAKFLNVYKFDKIILDFHCKKDMLKFIKLFNLNHIPFEINYYGISQFTDNEINELSKYPEVIYRFNNSYQYTDINRIIQTKQYLKLIIDEINELKLSSLEKYCYAYSIVKNFKEYKKNDKASSRYGNIAPRRSEFILFNDYICCSGYTELLSYIISGLKDHNLVCQKYTCKVNKDTTHSRCLIGINDDKYNINGIFISDCTFDSIKYSDINNDKYTWMLISKLKPLYPDCLELDASDFLLYDKHSKFINEKYEERLKEKFLKFNKEISNEELVNLPLKIKKAINVVKEAVNYDKPLLKDINLDSLNSINRGYIKLLLLSSGCEIIDSKIIYNPLLDETVPMLDSDGFRSKIFILLLKDKELALNILNCSLFDYMFLGGWLKNELVSLVANKKSKKLNNLVYSYLNELDEKNDIFTELEKLSNFNHKK